MPLSETLPRLSLYFLGIYQRNLKLYFTYISQATIEFKTKKTRGRLGHGKKFIFLSESMKANSFSRGVCGL